MSKKESMFVGEYEVKSLEHDGDETIVTLKGHDDITINDELLTLIMRPVKNEGSVTEAITHVLASKYLSELADYGLELYMIDSITQGMRTYAHNLREEAIGKAFDCTGALDIRLDKLM